MKQRIMTWTIVVLGILLVITNMWWIRFTFKSAYAVSDNQHEVAQLRRTLDQAFKLMPALDSPLSEVDLVMRAEDQIKSPAREKDGCYWVHELGFKFDDEGRLAHVTSNGIRHSQDACFPTNDD